MVIGPSTGSRSRYPSLSTVIEAVQTQGMSLEEIAFHLARWMARNPIETAKLNPFSVDPGFYHVFCRNAALDEHRAGLNRGRYFNSWRTSRAVSW